MDPQTFTKADLLKLPAATATPGVSPLTGGSDFLSQLNGLVSGVNTLICNMRELAQIWQGGAAGLGQGSPMPTAHGHGKKPAPEEIYSALLGVVNEFAQRDQSAAEVLTQLRNNKPQAVEAIRRLLT